jgi:Cu(I)/Ag(I) efflux system membrane fusion protein
MDTRGQKALLVPSEAVIQTGRRTVVMLAEDQGRFRPVEVQAGIESGGRTEILRGLQAGQKVVVSSQFLIDSEASLRGIEARLNAAPPPAVTHQGQGKVESVDKETATLSHGPIASLGMGAMTMEFKLPPPAAMPPTLKAGDTVDFEFRMEGDGPRLTRVTPTAPGAGK